MTTTILPSSARSGRYGLRQACRSERAKFFSIRSTWWTLAVTLVGTLAVTVLAVSPAAHHTRRWYGQFDATNLSLSGLYIGALAIGVLGALVFTSEYGSGTIRSSMSAMPRRLEFLLGKILLVAAFAMGTGELLAFSCFALGHAILGSSPVPAWGLSAPGVLRAVAGTGVTIGLLGIMGAAIGAAVRRTAGAIGIYVALLFLLPLLFTKMPGNLVRFTPLALIANSVASVIGEHGAVSASAALVLLVAYAAVLVLLGAVVVVRRDP